MNTGTCDRRFADRRLDDRSRPDGGAVIITICIFSILFAAIGFVAGTWFAWGVQ